MSVRLWWTRNHLLLIGLLLIAVTLAVFWQVLGHEFVNYDDDEYVTKNANVQAGLTPRAVAWAFTATRASNWHPLTWISHMLDCQVYKLDPMGHHLTNLLFHIANTLLLFLVLGRMTGSVWRSGFVAALFAIHPLHVESVAWVAERKDVLSTFLWMLVMLTYVRYVEHPGLKRYLPVVLLFALGLMAKPMLVTLPFVLLLLDYWPLGRFKPRERNRAWAGWKLVLEKAPLFVLSAGSSVITYIAQQGGGAVIPWERLPLEVRTAHALVAYVAYIGKMMWPRGLAVPYPHPGYTLPRWELVGAGLMLVCVSVLVVRACRGGRARPYLAVGWLWYLGTLVPVIGLVQVGGQAMADRYTYVPLIGLFIMVAWGVPELPVGSGGLRGGRRILLRAAAGVLISALMVGTWFQVRYWRNSVTLFSHVLMVTAGNWLAHNNLGTALYDLGRVDEAILQYQESIRIRPEFTKAHNNLGNAFVRQGRTDEAVRVYREAIRFGPDCVELHYNLGIALAHRGEFEQAIHEYREALRLEPDFPLAHYNLAVVFHNQGKTDEAIREYRQTIQLKPEFADAHNNLAVELFLKGDYAESWKEVHLCREYGGRPYSDLVNALSGKTPEPVE